MRVHVKELSGGRCGPVVSGADGLLPQTGHRTNTSRARGANIITSSRGWKCSTIAVSRTKSKWAAGNTRRKPPRRCCAIRACCSFQINPTFQRFDLQDLPHRRALGDTWAALAAERVMIDNTHGATVVLRGTGREMIPVPEIGGLRGTLRFPLCGAPDWQCQSFGACRTSPFPLHRK